MAVRPERVTTDEVRDLQVRALSAVAARWSRRPGGPSDGPARPEAPGAVAVETFAAGLAALVGTLPAGSAPGLAVGSAPGLAVGSAAGPAGGSAAGPADGSAAGPAADTGSAAERARQLLDVAAAVLDDVAEAARRAAHALAAAGADPAAEHADGIMTAASSLRILVALERAAIATA